jgi:hypothetical protein
MSCAPIESGKLVGAGRQPAGGSRGGIITAGREQSKGPLDSLRCGAASRAGHSGTSSPVIASSHPAFLQERDLAPAVAPALYWCPVDGHDPLADALSRVRAAARSDAL